MTEQGERTLSDADVQAIAAALESRLANRVVRGAGVGILQLVKRLLFWAIVMLFAYGVTHGFGR